MTASYRVLADSDPHLAHDFSRFPIDDAPPEIGGLQPSRRLMHDILAPALAGNAQVQARLASGKRCCLIVWAPHPEWYEAIHIALCHILEGGARARVHLARLDPEDDTDDEYDHILSRLQTVHVAVALTGAAPPDLDLIADIEVDLSSFPPTILQEVLAREFAVGTAEITVPDDLKLCDLRPAYLDGAVDRAPSAEAALAMASASTQRYRDRKAKQAADAEQLRAAKKAPSSPEGGAAVEVLRPTSPTLADLHGYGKAGQWAGDLVQDLSDYLEDRLEWADIDTGCLLHGPPGTGKTLFASALAASTGLPFIATSFAQWQGSRGGHLGDVVKALRDVFAAAQRNAPCILFVDEFDSIPRRGASREFDDYWRAIVNALLECLDGTLRREGVVVLAACNDPSSIDPALVRSGRLDRCFEIGLPDEEALTGILAHHLPDVGATVRDTVATALAGTASGADIARISREARRAARRDRRDVAANDLLSVAMPPCQLSPEHRRVVAVHEAGHAVAAMLLGYRVEALSMLVDGSSLGGVRANCGRSIGRVDDFERQAVYGLCGRAAEEVILGEPSGGAAGDLKEAAQTVSHMLSTCGLGDRLTPSRPAEHVIEARLQALYGRALRLVTEKRSAIEALADLALERRVLSARALSDFAEAHGLLPTGGASCYAS